MSCVHLKELFALCASHDVKVSSAEVVHFVCNKCQEKETCPSMLTDEYDARETQGQAARASVENRPDAPR